MDKTVIHLEEQLIGIRFGTITSGVVDTVRVECYGGNTELRYLASTYGDARRVSVTPYDISLLNPINSALKKAGFDSYIFSKNGICVNVPQACGEERDKIIKRVSSLGEEAKIAIRNVRKKARKEIDDETGIQKITDDAVADIECLVEMKIDQIRK